MGCLCRAMEEDISLTTGSLRYVLLCIILWCVLIQARTSYVRSIICVPLACVQSCLNRRHHCSGIVIRLQALFGVGWFLE